MTVTVPKKETSLRTDNFPRRAGVESTDDNDFAKDIQLGKTTVLTFPEDSVVNGEGTSAECDTCAKGRIHLGEQRHRGCLPC
jgi:hypothetical protein